MSNVISMRDDEQLEVATRWVLKMDEGDLSLSDKKALETWLDEDASHHMLLMEVAAVWDKTESLAILADLVPHDAASRKTETSLIPAGWSWSMNLGFGASLTVIAVVATLLLQPVFEHMLKPDVGLEESLAMKRASYETLIGEQKTVLLPDGSEVVLNTNSQVAVTFTSTARLLHLVRGEVLVKVAKDKTRPLSVFAGEQIVQAVGTEFTVEITTEKQVEVLVTEGKVVVGVRSVYDEFGTEKLVGMPPVIAQLEDNTISAGESVILDGDELTRETVTSDGIEVLVSWADGSLVFRSEPLESALQEIERYTTVEFIVLDEALKTETVSGRFKAGDVDALLLSLRVNFNITYEYDGENRILLSSLGLSPEIAAEKE